MHKTVKALILREVRYKEADRILNVLSEEGKLILKAPEPLKKTAKRRPELRRWCIPNSPCTSLSANGM